MNSHLPIQGPKVEDGEGSALQKLVFQNRVHSADLNFTSPKSSRKEKQGAIVKFLLKVLVAENKHAEPEHLKSICPAKKAFVFFSISVLFIFFLFAVGFSPLTPRIMKPLSMW